MEERFQKCKRGEYSLSVRSLGLHTSIWLESEIERRPQLQWSESELAATLQNFKVLIEEVLRCSSYLWSLFNRKQVQSRSWRAGN